MWWTSWGTRVERFSVSEGQEWEGGVSPKNQVTTTQLQLFHVLHCPHWMSHNVFNTCSAKNGHHPRHGLYYCHCLKAHLVSLLQPLVMVMVMRTIPFKLHLLHSSTLPGLSALTPPYRHHRYHQH